MLAAPSAAENPDQGHAAFRGRPHRRLVSSVLKRHPFPFQVLIPEAFPDAFPGANLCLSLCSLEARTVPAARGEGGAQGAVPRRVLELLLSAGWLENPSLLAVEHRPWHKIMMKLLLKSPLQWADGSLLGEDSLVGSMCQEFEKWRGREQLQGW